MRQLSEINKDIEEINGRIAILKAQRILLVDERRERKFADFCEKYGVKKGDVVRTDRYGDIMVCGMDEGWSDWIKVRKIKKNGEPYNVTYARPQSMFNGCKVIGHIDMED